MGVAALSRIRAAPPRTSAAASMASWPSAASARNQRSSCSVFGCSIAQKAISWHLWPNSISARSSDVMFSKFSRSCLWSSVMPRTASRSSCDMASHRVATALAYFSW